MRAKCWIGECMAFTFEGFADSVTTGEPTMSAGEQFVIKRKAITLDRPMQKPSLSLLLPSLLGQAYSLVSIPQRKVSFEMSMVHVAVS